MSLKVRSCAGARTQLNDEAAGSTPRRANWLGRRGGASPSRRRRRSPREIPEDLLQQGSPRERRHPRTGDRRRAVRPTPTVARAADPASAALPSRAQPADGADRGLHRFHDHQPAVRLARDNLHHPAADCGDRCLGHRSDLDHPYCRHRLGGWRDRYPRDARDGQPSRQQRCAGGAGPADRLCRRHRYAGSSTACWSLD